MFSAHTHSFQSIDFATTLLIVTLTLLFAATIHTYISFYYPLSEAKKAERHATDMETHVALLEKETRFEAEMSSRSPDQIREFARQVTFYREQARQSRRWTEVVGGEANDLRKRYWVCILLVLDD